MGIQYPIEFKEVTKTFRVYKDKSHTFKDRVLSHKRNKYSVNRVLDNVSFSVKKGEALGLIGHNGCGKSTTLKLLNKILYPDSGEIIMRGRISSLIELGAGFHPDMTGRENIYINATIFGLHKKEIDRRLDDIIRFSELEDYIDNPVRTYSSGMYMRLAFAIAINVDASILLVDEILAVGDVNFQKKCFDKLREIKRGGATIVIVSHTMDQIKSICDNVIWLEGGKIKELGPAATVCEDYLLEMRQLSNERKKLEAEEKGQLDPQDVIAKYPPEKVAPQHSKYAVRTGNMRLRFRHIELQDYRKTRSLIYEFQKPLNIIYSITADDEITIKDYRVKIVLNILKDNGTLCTSFDSYRILGRPLNEEELTQGVLNISSVNLAEGNYILDALIVDDKGEIIDFLSHLIDFQVKNLPRNGIEITAMPNTWTLRDN